MEWSGRVNRVRVSSVRSKGVAWESERVRVRGSRRVSGMREWVE